MAKKKKKFTIWPKIYSIDSAKEAIKQGIYASLFIGIITIGY